MRISDWSSDVCSSDLEPRVNPALLDQRHQRDEQAFVIDLPPVRGEAYAADVDEMAGAGEQRHRLALPEGRGDDRQVVQMAGALPRIVGDEGVALAHRRDGKAVDEVLYRQRQDRKSTRLNSS